MNLPESELTADQIQQLPEGVTPEMATRLRAFAVELNALGLSVCLSASDANAQTCSIVLGDAMVLQPVLSTLSMQLTVRMIEAAGPGGCTCPTCAALRQAHAPKVRA